MEGTEIDEDMMIDMAQRCFVEIAKQMAKQKATVESLYAGKTFTKTVEGEEVELLSHVDFIEGLRKLGLSELQTIEYACLLKVLAVNDQEKYIRVQDLIQILEDYEDGKADVQSAQKRTQTLHIEKLDNVSMIIMLALTEYIIKAEIQLDQLFAGKIYQQSVQTPAGERQISLPLGNPLLTLHARSALSFI